MLKGKGRIIKLILAVVFIGILAGGSASFLVGLAAYKSLPTIEEIRNRTVAQSTKIYDREGEVILYELGDSQKRTLVSLQDMPDSLKNATVAIEDERFWDNNRPVVDWRGIVRAIYANLTSGAIVQGGSTITQQLAKKAFLSDERTWDRKAKELLLAFRLSREYSKEKILEMYLNEIPYGATIYGVEAAARSYFGKDLKDLNEAESAVIASIPKAPTYYNPWGSHRKQLLERKDVVLKKMYDLGYLSKENYERATKLPIKFQPQSEGILAPHFSLMVQEYLVEKYGEELVRTGGLKVITTLDWKIQQAAEKAVLEGAQIILIDPIVLKDHPVHGRHTEEGEDPVPFNVIEEAIEIHPWKQDQCITRENRSEANLLSQDVEQGASLDNDIVTFWDETLTDGPLLRGSLEKEDMSEGHTFGQASCASGVEHLHEIKGVCLKRRKNRNGAFFEEALEPEDMSSGIEFSARYLVEGPSDQALPPGKKLGQVGDDHPFPFRFVKHLRNVAEVRIKAKDRFSSAIIAHILQIRGGINGRNGDGHRAEALQGKPGHHPLGAIREIENDLIALRDAQTTKAGGEMLDCPLKLGKTVSKPKIDEGRLSRVLPDHFFKLLIDGVRDHLLKSFCSARFKPVQ